MSLNELQLEHVIVLTICILALLLILFVVHQIDELDNGETGNPVEIDNIDNNVYDQGRLSLPIKETQKQGIHPSMAYRGAIKMLKERCAAMELNPYDREEPWPLRRRGVQNPHGKRQEREVKQEPSEGAQQELVHDDSNHAVGTNSKGEETNKSENHGEQPSSTQLPGEPQSAELSPVPGDVDRSDPDTTLSEATDEQTGSGEQPSASGMNATALPPPANPATLMRKKKDKKKKKKKKNKKNSFEKTSSGDEKPAAVSDPETSTDESHHSSIEAFSSDFEEELKNDQGARHEQMDLSREAACPKEKCLDK